MTKEERAAQIEAYVAAGKPFVEGQYFMRSKPTRKAGEDERGPYDRTKFIHSIGVGQSSEDPRVMEFVESVETRGFAEGAENKIPHRAKPGARVLVLFSSTSGVFGKNNTYYSFDKLEGIVEL